MPAHAAALGLRNVYVNSGQRQSVRRCFSAQEGAKGLFALRGSVEPGSRYVFVFIRDN